MLRKASAKALVLRRMRRLAIVFLLISQASAFNRPLPLVYSLSRVPAASVERRVLHHAKNNAVSVILSMVEGADNGGGGDGNSAGDAQTASTNNPETGASGIDANENSGRTAEGISVAAPVTEGSKEGMGSPQRSDNLNEQQLSGKQLMTALGTSPRRIILSFLSASGIALGTNFLGCTSALLNLVPEDVVETSGLDTFYPRGQFKRFRGTEYGYSFLLPKQWVADTALELAKAQRRVRALDYTMANRSSPSGGGVLPDAAFGPPGRLNSRGVSQGDTNVSVVASQVAPGFTLQGTLGSPQNAADTLLRVSLAPEGSGRTATLIAACEELRGVAKVYQFEYVVDRGSRGVPLRAISVVAGREEGTLITLTVVAPASDWEEAGGKKDAQLRRVAESFKLTR